MIRTAID